MKEELGMISWRFFKYLKSTIGLRDFIDVRDRSNSYREFLFEGKPVLANLSIERAKWKAIPICFNDRHPFVNALKKAEASIDFRSTLKKELTNYYMTVQPEDLSYFGCDFDSACAIENCSRHSIIWPWTTKINESGKTPVIKYGVKFRLPISEHGVQHWGPVSERKLNTEVGKFSKLYYSIKEHGFKSDKSSLSRSVDCFIIEGSNLDWRWIPIQGQHRVSVAASLDIKHIPVKVRYIIREVDVEILPQVINKNYSVQAARKIFDTFFDDDYSPDVFISHFGSRFNPSIE